MNMEQYGYGSYEIPQPGYNYYGSNYYNVSNYDESNYYDQPSSYHAQTDSGWQVTPQSIDSDTRTQVSQAWQLYDLAQGEEFAAEDASDRTSRLKNAYTMYERCAHEFLRVMPFVLDPYMRGELDQRLSGCLAKMQQLSDDLDSQQRNQPSSGNDNAVGFMNKHNTSQNMEQYQHMNNNTQDFSTKQGTDGYWDHADQYQNSQQYGDNWQTYAAYTYDYGQPGSAELAQFAYGTMDAPSTHSSTAPMNTRQTSFFGQDPYQSGNMSTTEPRAHPDSCSTHDAQHLQGWLGARSSVSSTSTITGVSTTQRLTQANGASKPTGTSTSSNVNDMHRTHQREYARSPGPKSHGRVSPINGTPKDKSKRIQSMGTADISPLQNARGTQIAGSELQRQNKLDNHKQHLQVNRTTSDFSNNFDPFDEILKGSRTPKDTANIQTQQHSSVDLLGLASPAMHTAKQSAKEIKVTHRKAAPALPDFNDPDVDRVRLRGKAVTEIITTERNYIRFFELFVQFFVDPLRPPRDEPGYDTTEERDGIPRLTSFEHARLFNEVQELLPLHYVFYFRLLQTCLRRTLPKPVAKLPGNTSANVSTASKRKSAPAIAQADDTSNGRKRAGSGFSLHHRFGNGKHSKSAEQPPRSQEITMRMQLSHYLAGFGIELGDGAPGEDDIIAKIERHFEVDYDELRGAGAIIPEWDNRVGVGKLFLEFAPFFKMYSRYCYGHNKAGLILDQLLQTRKKFKEWIAAQEAKASAAAAKKGAGTSQLALSSLMAMPVQRVPRYALLLKEVQKRTPERHLDAAPLGRALTQVEAAASKLDASVARFENQLRVIDIQRRLKPNPEPSLVAAHREFVMEGKLRKVCRPFYALRTYTVFLFSDVLVYGTPERTLSLWGDHGNNGMSGGGGAQNAGAFGGVRVNLHNLIHFHGVEDVSSNGKGSRTSTSKNPQDDARIKHVSSKSHDAFRVLGTPKNLILIAANENEKQRWIDAINTCLLEARQREMSRDDAKRRERDARKESVALMSGSSAAEDDLVQATQTKGAQQSSMKKHTRPTSQPTALDDDLLQLGLNDNSKPERHDHTSSRRRSIQLPSLQSRQNSNSLMSPQPPVSPIQSSYVSSHNKSNHTYAHELRENAYVGGPSVQVPPQKKHTNQADTTNTFAQFDPFASPLARELAMHKSETKKSHGTGTKRRHTHTRHTTRRNSQSHAPHSPILSP